MMGEGFKISTKKIFISPSSQGPGSWSCTKPSLENSREKKVFISKATKGKAQFHLLPAIIPTSGAASAPGLKFGETEGKREICSLISQHNNNPDKCELSPKLRRETERNSLCSSRPAEFIQQRWVNINKKVKILIRGRMLHAEWAADIWKQTRKGIFWGGFLFCQKKPRLDELQL